MSLRELSEKHWASFIFVRSFQATLRNTSELITSGVFLLFLIIIFNNIWRAFGTGHQALAADSAWYFFLNELIALSSMELSRRMRRDNKQGLLISQFLRPASVPLVYVAQTMGRSVARTLFYLAVLSPCIYLYTGKLPSSLSGFMFSLCVVPLAMIIDSFFLAAIGCLNLWIGDTLPLELVYQKSAFLLGGMMVPISFYPDSLILIAQCTPFYWLMYGHSRFVFGGTVAQMTNSLFFIVLWLIVSLGITLLSYRSATRRLYFSGGVG
jgi:ABC-2 type transport system permease protein